MFTSQQRPTNRLLKTKASTNANTSDQEQGILIGGDTHWHPSHTANPHGCIIGGSGAGKTQTLKAIAYEVSKLANIVIIDFHGDQAIAGETCYRINMESPIGINPLTINLDREGGGPNLRAIELAILLKKTLVMGPNQEGMVLEAIKSCYSHKGIFQEHPNSWRNPPPNFADLEEELNRRATTEFEDEEMEALAGEIDPQQCPIGVLPGAGIYFAFHGQQLIYVGCSTNIERRVSQYHHVLTPARRKAEITIRSYGFIPDWHKLLTLENYLIDRLKPTLNQTVLRKQCKESAKLRLKLAATFQYGIFSRPQPASTAHTRWDLSKLPPELQAIAGDALASQLMNAHRLDGQSPLKTVLFIDEAKELGYSRALDRIAADGRKYGLGLWVASQSCRHISKDVLTNTFTKIVLPVDSSELALTARTFRFSEEAIANLSPLESLVRFGKNSSRVHVKPYYQRI